MTPCDQGWDSMLLCPYGEVGESALHEAIQDGWEPLLAFRCESEFQHIVLRRPSSADTQDDQ